MSSAKLVIFLMLFISMIHGQIGDVEAGGSATPIEGITPGLGWNTTSDTSVGRSDTVETMLDKYGVVQRITDDDYNSMPSVTLPEFIQYSSSAYICDRGLAQSPRFFSSRIYESRRAILLDGEPLYMPQSRDYNLYGFPIEALNGAEYIDGGMGVQYGDDCFDGALNLHIDNKPLPYDFTRVMANWGNNKRRILSGLFKKRINEQIGFGVTGREFTGDLHRGDGDCWMQNFSAIIWIGHDDLNLTVFGTQHEGDINTIEPVDSTGQTPNPGRQKDDSRILRAKATYQFGDHKFALAFTHQDYFREFWYRPEGTDDHSEDESNTDAGKASVELKNILGLDLYLDGSIRRYTLNSNVTDHHVFDELESRIITEYSFRDRISLSGFVRLSGNLKEQILVSPALAFVAPAGDMLEVFAIGQMAEREPTINEMYYDFTECYPYSYSPDDSTTVYDTSYTIIHGNSALKTENSMGTEFGFIHRQGDELKVVLKGKYHQIKDMIHWGFSEENDTSVWLSENLDEATIWGVDVHFSYGNSSVFQLGGGYSYIVTEDHNGNQLTGIPVHRGFFFAEESKNYLDNQLQATLRMEGEGYLGIIDEITGNEFDPAIILRARLRMNFLSFTAFGLYEYAFTKRSDVWENESYLLDTDYLLPKTQWRGGISWEFID